ncbi:MAG: rod shape-determining protein, partial [Bacteroidales bacterium]|nr:rod shape-determining protein [Bacteroidales bacterium]
NFKVFIGSRRHSINIDNVFNSMGIAIAKKYFTPGITARAVLKEEQMENGVALIDIGAGVSSVTIFKGKIMRYYAAIPFGGNSITNDIKSECNFSFALAENIKRAYGACMPNKLSALGEKSIQIVDENDIPTAQVTVKYISEIISARMKEIIEALLYHIQISGYAAEDILRAGVVVTGGGAELVNCANYIKELSGYSVKIGVPRRFYSFEGCPEAGETGAATSMGMIMAAKGDQMLNCIKEAPARRYWTAPKVDPVPTDTSDTEPAEGPAARQASQPDTFQTAPAEPEPVERVDVQGPENDERPIEDSVIAAQEEGPSVFDVPTQEEIDRFKDRKKKEKTKTPKEPRQPRPRLQVTWFKHIQSSVEEMVGGIFDKMENEDV